MGTANHAAGERQWGADGLLYSEEMQADSAADDVDDGVNCADFMKVDFIQGNLMNFCLRFAEIPEDVACPDAYRLSERTLGKHSVDLRPAAGRLLVFANNFDARAADTVTFFGALLQLVSGDGKLCQSCFDEIEVDAQINQQAEHHVTGDPGKGVKVENVHDDFFRLMRVAANAAPKPLSILTTVTPPAQELSMPSSAATPPKAAP